MKKKIKALALFSGGLDSILAVKLMQDQGVKVRAVKFTTKFFSKDDDNSKAIESAQDLGIKLDIFDISKDYLKILRNPKYGYGTGINPCIDCKTLMFKKGGEYAQKIKADFIFTGEVLGERPMSQNHKALHIIHNEAGLKGKILRPLSAKLLSETEAEKKGYIDRNRLFDIQGRRRDKQILLAKKYKIKEYPSPAGGCLLCEKSFSMRVKDLFKHEKNVSVDKVELLKYGRHFRFGDNKVIVGRNKQDNEILLKIKDKDDYFFKVPITGTPITLLTGNKSKSSIMRAAELTLAYSDSEADEDIVLYGKKEPSKKIKVRQERKSHFRKFMV